MSLNLPYQYVWKTSNMLLQVFSSVVSYWSPILVFYEFSPWGLLLVLFKRQPGEICSPDINFYSVVGLLCLTMWSVLLMQGWLYWKFFPRTHSSFVDLFLA